MKKWICTGVLSFIMVILSVSVYAASSVPEPVMKAASSVVRVLAEYPDAYSTGSGFIIKSDQDETLIATNYHVVEGDPYSISVWIGENQTISAEILASTSQKDMCILRLSCPLPLKKALTLSDRGARQGGAVYAVGFPAAADYLSDKEAHASVDATITDGIVSAVREATVSGYGTPVRILQINAAINSGNSGGPLFDAGGAVVGINTYGIDDAQGIFGAIDVSELKAFLADHAIVLSEPKAAFPWGVVGILGAAAAAGVLVVWLILRRKRIAAPKDACVSLRMYMQSHPDGIGMQDAAAMLLPAALQLKKLHDGGHAHLQVSPDSVSVDSDGAKLADAEADESNRYASGYAAPEIYRGADAGQLSDIYSFCAVLLLAASGRQPENALNRVEKGLDEPLPGSFDPPFAELLKTGMALDPADRFPSMQEVISRLALYRVGPFENLPVPEADAPAAKRRAHRPARVIAAAAALLVVLGLSGAYAGCYLSARSSAQSGDFVSAEKLLLIPQLTRLHDADLVRYIRAGSLMTGREYEKAEWAFAQLEDYMNAEALVSECRYRRALQCADRDDFDGAAEIMTALAADGYRDAGQKLKDIRFRSGAYLLLEQGDYRKADQIFASLAGEGYEGAEEMQKETQYVWACALADEGDYVGAYHKLEDIWDYSDVYDFLCLLEEVMYDEGCILYADSRYAEAKEYFECISPYGDSDSYLVLIKAHTLREYDMVLGEDTAEDLMELFWFEDAAGLLLSKHSLAEPFLCGTWEGDGYSFTMETGGDIEYNLPWFDYGDCYTISEGVLLVYPEGYEDQAKALFRFEAISPDCIEVFCYKNNSSYILYRQ